MFSGMKLVGGIVLNANKEHLKFPATLLAVFEKDGEYYIQSSKRAPHPYTYLEDCTFEKLSPQRSEIYVNNRENFVHIRKKHPNLDFSKKVYLFALSEGSILVGNLLEFSQKVNNLKIQSERVLEIKQFYKEKCNQYLKYGFTSQNNEILKHLEEYSL